MQTNVLTKTDSQEEQAGNARHSVRLIDLIDDMCAGKDIFFQSVRVVADVMTANPKTMTLDDKVEAALSFMKDNKIRHIPVVDVPEEGADPVFVGVLSGRDIGRHLSPYVGKIGQEDADRQGLRDPLSQVITRKPFSVSPETGMTELLTIMIDHRVNMVPVLDGGDLVGVVTTADILGLFIRIHQIRQLCQRDGESQRKMRLLDLTGKAKTEGVFYTSFKTVEDMMTENPVCLEEDDHLATAVDVMQKSRFRHVPIIDENKRLKGLLSDRNVLRQLPGPRRDRTGQNADFRAGLFDVDLKDPRLTVPVRRIMMLDVPKSLPDYNIYDAAMRMQDTRTDALVITDETEVVQGILTVTDFMRALLATYEFTAKQSS